MKQGVRKVGGRRAGAGRDGKKERMKMAKNSLAAKAHEATRAMARRARASFPKVAIARGQPLGDASAFLLLRLQTGYERIPVESLVQIPWIVRLTVILSG